jgi:hypothetical protein
MFPLEALMSRTSLAAILLISTLGFPAWAQDEAVALKLIRNHGGIVNLGDEKAGEPKDIVFFGRQIPEGAISPHREFSGKMKRFQRD